MSTVLRSAVPLFFRLCPGLGLSLLLAGAALWLGRVSGWPAALIALVLGFAAGRLLRLELFQPGLVVSKHLLLKFGIVLLGASIPIEAIAALHGSILLFLPSLVIATIMTGVVTAKWLRRDPAFGFLAGGAVAICGASAALAIYAGLPPERRKDTQLAFCIFGATALSTAAMLAYPLLLTALGYDALQAGGVIGASIHDVAQVVGAGFSLSPEAGEMAVLIKMSRVLCLPVVVIAAGVLFRSRSGVSGRAPIVPAWFIVGFFILLGLNSLNLIPDGWHGGLQPFASVLLLAAIAALASQTDLFSSERPGVADWTIMLVPSLVLLALALFVFALAIV